MESIHELTPFEQGAVSILRAARASKEQEILSKAQVSFTHDQVLEQSATYIDLRNQEARALGGVILKHHRSPFYKLCNRAAQMQHVVLPGSKQRPYQVLTPLLWPYQEDIDGLPIHCGWRFRAHAIDTYEQPNPNRERAKRFTRLLALSSEELAINADTGEQEISGESVLKLGYFWPHHPEGVIELSPRGEGDPDAEKYQTELGLFRAARLELGDTALKVVK